MKHMKHLRMVQIATVRPSNNNQEQVMSPLPQRAIVALVLSITFFLVVVVALSHLLPSGVDPEVFITTTLDLLKPSGTEAPPPVMGGAALPFSAV